MCSLMLDYISSPDGVSTPTALVTINMELLTEFRAHNFNWASSKASGFQGTRDAGHPPINGFRQGCACDKFHFQSHPSRLGVSVRSPRGGFHPS